MTDVKIINFAFNSTVKHKIITIFLRIIMYLLLFSVLHTYIFTVFFLLHTYRKHSILNEYGGVLVYNFSRT